MLQQTFHSLLSRYTHDAERVNALWIEIETQYGHKSRYYHTLEHLENLLHQLTQVKAQIKSWDTLLFSLYYHDVVYNPLKKNNEEKSALLAGQRMQSISVPEPMIEACKRQILATKTHQSGADTDTDFFTDADLSILGADWDNYAAYARQVRQEYAVFPDILYHPGRKKVLLHFLQMDRIYKTPYFFEILESRARRNLRQELQTL